MAQLIINDRSRNVKEGEDVFISFQTNHMRLTGTALEKLGVSEGESITFILCEDGDYGTEGNGRQVSLENQVLVIPTEGTDIPGFRVSEGGAIQAPKVIKPLQKAFGIDRTTVQVYVKDAKGVATHDDQGEPITTTEQRLNRGVFSIEDSYDISTVVGKPGVRGYALSLIRQDVPDADRLTVQPHPRRKN
jgi:hypothetical protein